MTFSQRRKRSGESVIRKEGVGHGNGNVGDGSVGLGDLQYVAARDLKLIEILGILVEPVSESVGEAQGSGDVGRKRESQRLQLGVVSRR